MTLFNGKTIESSQVTYSGDFELVEIAHSDHLSVDEFLNKPDWYRGFITAHYRGKHQIEAVLMQEQKLKDEKLRAEQEAKRMGQRG